MVNLSKWKDKNEWLYVALGKGGNAEERIKKSDARAIALHLPVAIPSLRTIFNLYRFLRKEKPDVLHTSGAEANFFGFLAGKLAGVPKIIVEEIGIPNHSRKAKAIFGFIFRYADYTVGESEAVVRYITKQFNLSPQKTTVVYNFGVFNYDFSKVSVNKIKDTFDILMVSRLEPVKNIEGVLNVLSGLKKETKCKVKLIIAGTGSSENSLKKMVYDLDLEDSVEFVGFINDPYPYLLNSDLFILNSFSEGFSNSLVESMYSNTLSLSTAVGAAPEIIEDGVNGFLVPPNDEHALFEKIESIIKLTKEKRKEIGEAGHKTVVENFSLKKHVSELMKLYQN
ncbi:glycosyltransferase family 4 protein [Parapusillimonas sp. SGNA-6]|nr:glycosyltransferase family 4 protein [Parapedobacter sp. SGR-10]NGM89240.1 glycosyltransferase family 4 protein [Parapusillimonas sp. SGNA-6]